MSPNPQMTARATALASLVVVLVATAALAGVTAWPTLLKLGAVFAGWVFAAYVVRWDASRFGQDGERAGRIVIFFGWAGLAYRLVKRRRLVASG